MDALELIAEARRKQEAAERERDHWKNKSDAARRRLKGVIEMAKRYPIDPPPVDQDGIPDWDHIMRVVNHFADVVSDRYAAFDEDGLVMNHETAREMMCWRIQDWITRAVKNEAAPKQEADH